MILVYKYFVIYDSSVSAKAYLTIVNLKKTCKKFDLAKTS